MPLPSLSLPHSPVHPQHLDPFLLYPVTCLPLNIAFLTSTLPQALSTMLTPSQPQHLTPPLIPALPQTPNLLEQPLLQNSPISPFALSSTSTPRLTYKSDLPQQQPHFQYSVLPQNQFYPYTQLYTTSLPALLQHPAPPPAPVLSQHQPASNAQTIILST